MANRLRSLGVILGLIGAVCLVAGAVAFFRTNEGMGALQDFSATQNVNLSYNEDGELIDRGTTEGAEAIKTMITEDWGYPLVDGDLDPNDPLVNTASEYMFQMGTIVYHVANGNQTVVLEEDVEYNGEVFPAGTYEFDVDGRYWTDFDRTHPIEGPAREQAWSGTVHGLVGELGVGVVTHTSIQIGYAVAGILAGLGLVSLMTGLGLFWAGRATPVTAEARRFEPAKTNGHGSTTGNGHDESKTEDQLVGA